MGIYRTLEAVVCLLSVCSTVLAGKAGSSNTETDEVRLSKTTGVKSSDPSYGIGFDLSTSYGTAVISYPDGSSSILARVPAPASYRESLAVLSLDSSKHLSPPYDNMDEELHDYPRQKIRQAKKAAGLPASDDVAQLGNLLIDLRTAAEEKLGHPITEAVASTPNLVALYDEDVRDAFEFVGLKFSKLPYWQHKVLSTGAAYAGYGMGLCGDYTDQAACWYEQKDMPQETIMAVTFTQHALHVTLSGIQSVLWIWEPQYRTHWDWELGLGKLEEEGVDEDEYWAEVVEAMRFVMHDRPHYPKPQKILLLGESAGDPKFRDALEKAIWGVMGKMPVVYGVDAEFVAAKGAAELAKRAPYDWRKDPFAEEPERPKQEQDLSDSTEVDTEMEDEL